MPFILAALPSALGLYRALDFIAPFFGFACFFGMMVLARRISERLSNSRTCSTAENPTPLRSSSMSSAFSRIDPLSTDVEADSANEVLCACGAIADRSESDRNWNGVREAAVFTYYG